MGIPAYFRWISAKFPRIMVDCVEHLVTNPGQPPAPPSDVSGPNPNGVEFDNLYLDMNGIIHPCTHPEDAPPPTTEQEMFDAVNEYIDRIVAIVRPRKILYMAIDGVAPRAKINQQRSRRFRAAKEAQHKAREAEALKREWEQKGLKVASLTDSAAWPKDLPKQLGKVRTDEDESDDAPFDSNVITPGTPFMERLAVSLRAYVANRIASTPGWENLRVIFSDASVPGEGEHKIAEFIRVERAMPGFDPNIRHVLYGLDADLIMLALATHELHFSVLREEVFPKNGAQRDSFGGPPGPTLSGAIEDTPMDLETASSTAAGAPNQLRTRAELGGKKPFHFLHVHILREYLDIEFRYDIERELAAAALHPSPDAPKGLVYDLDNVIDDFVFLCFFVGNDFLPHLPTLDIREGAVDYIIEVYKTDLPHVGYLTSGAGDVDISRVRKMMSRIGMKEDEVFQERKQRELQSLARAAEDRKRADEYRARQAARQNRGESVAPPAEGSVGLSQAYDRRDTGNDLDPKAPKTPFTQRVVLPAKSQGVNSIAATPRPDPPPPSEDELVTLGDRNKRARVGDGTANKLAAARLRSAIEMKKNAAAGKQKRPLGSVAPQIRKVSTSPRPQRDVAQRAALAAINERQGSSSVSPVVSFQEKKPEEFEEELRNRLREQNEIKEPVDDVRLGDEGWKDRYYKNKFNWGPLDVQAKQQMFRSYIEGLYWVMKYYYVGCISWVWYYPYHYAPFASDIVTCDVSSDDMKLEMGKPFLPFTQLQAVMPACSGALVLPVCYSRLMTDLDSPIIEYYPEEFEIDLNGKRFAWQGVALLPFIDEERLQSALANLDHLLTAEERKRNSYGECVILAHQGSSLGRYIKELEQQIPPIESETRNQPDVSQYPSSTIPESVAEGQLFGTISPRPSTAGTDVYTMARFDLPERRPHITKVLNGVQAPPRVLDISAAETGRSGWKAARFGSLGRAAKILAQERDSRLSSRGKSQHRDASGALYQPQSYFGPQGLLPHPAATAMFGGLGASSTQEPTWMRQPRPSAPRRSEQHQQQHVPYHEQQIMFQQQQMGQTQFVFPQQRAPGQYQLPSEQQPYAQYQYAYGAEAMYGGSGHHPHQQYAVQGYGEQAHWGLAGAGASTHRYGYAGLGAGGAGGYQNLGEQFSTNIYNANATTVGGGFYPSDATGEAGGYNFSTNPVHYVEGGGVGGGIGGNRGGLAGPTAMQMRQGSASYARQLGTDGTRPQQVGWGNGLQGHGTGRGRGSGAQQRPYGRVGRGGRR